MDTPARWERTNRDAGKTRFRRSMRVIGCRAWEERQRGEHKWKMVGDDVHHGRAGRQEAASDLPDAFRLGGDRALYGSRPSPRGGGDSIILKENPPPTKGRRVRDNRGRKFCGNGAEDRDGAGGEDFVEPVEQSQLVSDR